MARRLFTILTAGACVAIAVWTIALAVTLPRHYVASHWRLTWVGLDAAMAFFLARTAWLTYRRKRGVVITAVVTGTLLCVDAWFDIVTATGESDRATSLATGVFGNIPLAIVLFWAARRVLHAPHDDRPSLALDLIEEVRPVIADAVVVRLVRTGQVTPADFTTSHDGCRLDDAARRRFLTAYEKRMLTLVHHPAEDRRIPWRQVLYAQARQLAAVFEDREPNYVPVVWR